MAAATKHIASISHAAQPLRITTLDMFRMTFRRVQRPVSSAAKPRNVPRFVGTGIEQLFCKPPNGGPTPSQNPKP